VRACLQEEGNIPYVLDNEVGAFETRPAAIAALLDDWLLRQPAQLVAMSKRSKALGRPEVRAGGRP
jgi:1,2-diacylglycerol 3-beta-galactosyltransferase